MHQAVEAIKVAQSALTTVESSVEPVEGSAAERDVNLSVYRELVKLKGDKEAFNRRAEELAQELGISVKAVKQRFYNKDWRERKKDMKSVGLRVLASADVSDAKTLPDSASTKLPVVKFIPAVNHMIYRVVMQAREMKLDSKVIYQHLAEFLNLSPKAVEMRFYSTRSLLKKGFELEPDDPHAYANITLESFMSKEVQTEQIEQSEGVLDQSPAKNRTKVRNVGGSKDQDLVMLVRQLKEERDRYKRLYEEAKARLDEIRSVLES